ncbi:hypothetical protein JCM18899A_21340 [Nocardioides sp. AN3]
MTLVHYRAGRIFTAAEPLWAESVVTDGDRIAYVGDTETADRLAAGADTVELDGAFVLPGIVDAHTHLVNLGESLAQVDLLDAADLGQIQARVASAAAADLDAPRVRGRSWLFAALGGRALHRAMFDAVEPDRPVYLTAADLHSAWVNSAALRELGITRSTPDPLGGRIERDADGEATGFLLENAALGLMRDVLDGLTTDVERLAAQDDAFACYLAAGVTSAVDMGLGEEELRPLEQALARDGRLPLRMGGHWIVNRTGDRERDLAQVARAVHLRRTHRGPWLHIQGIKIFVDGVIESCTAAMEWPFADGRHPDALWDHRACRPMGVRDRPARGRAQRRPGRDRRRPVRGRARRALDRPPAPDRRRRPGRACGSRILPRVRPQCRCMCAR